MERIITSNAFTLRYRTLPHWQAGLVVAGACAAAIAFALLASGLFLILLPLALVGGLAYRFLRSRPRIYATTAPRIIEGEYVVLSEAGSDERTRG